MVTPLEERAASVVTGKQPILGWRQPLGAAVNPESCATASHAFLPLLGSDDAVPAVDVAH